MVPKDFSTMTTLSWAASLLLIGIFVPSPGYTLQKVKEDLVDPYAWDYDRSTQTNKQTDLIKGSDIDCSSEITRRVLTECGAIKGGQHAEKKCDLGDDDEVTLFRHVARSILEHYTQDPGVEYLHLTMSPYQRERLQKYIRGDEDIPKADVKDMLVASLTVPDRPNSSDMHTLQGSGFTKKEVMIGLLVAVLSVFIFLMVFKLRISLFRIVIAISCTAIIMSVVWSYMFLYQQKMAKRMSDDAVRGEYNEACRSSKNDSLLTGIWKFFKQNNDDCEKYFIDHQVHIALEVLPIDAVLHTWGTIMTSFSEFIGVSMAKISGSFLGALPFRMWIPAFAGMLIFFVAMLAVYLYCSSSRRHINTPERVPTGIEDHPPEPIGTAPPHRYALTDVTREAPQHRGYGGDRLEEVPQNSRSFNDAPRDFNLCREHGDGQLEGDDLQRQLRKYCPRDSVHTRNHERMETQGPDRYDWNEGFQRMDVDRGSQRTDGQDYKYLSGMRHEAIRNRKQNKAGGYVHDEDKYASTGKPDDVNKPDITGQKTDVRRMRGDLGKAALEVERNRVEDILSEGQPGGVQDKSSIASLTELSKEDSDDDFEVIPEEG